MREILFRGKRVDNGEWVYGLLWKKKYGFKAPDMTVSEFIEDEITTIIEAEGK